MTTTVHRATVHHATVAPTALDPHRRPAVAAGIFVGTWVLGLTAFPAGPAVDASTGEVARFYADHAVASGSQSIAIHGIAPVALAGVFLAVANASRASRLVRAAGLTGVGLSLLQLALGLARSIGAEESSASSTTALFDAINRVDGLKMLAFAAMIAASTSVLRQHERLGRTMAITSGAAVAALVVSAVGYLLLHPTLGLAAFVSLPLLLVWAAAAAFVVGRRAG